MKKTKLLVVVLALVLALSTLALCACGGDKGETIEVVFEGYETKQLEVGSEVTVPSVTLAAGEKLIGWATSPNATSAKFKMSTIAYEDLSSYVDGGKVTLYPVIDATVIVTVKGLEDKVTTLSSMTKNTAAVLVGVSDRQAQLGWATTEGATEPTIPLETVLNYASLKQYADSEAKVTLYPVVKTYDLMIALHASHSNGNVYVSDEQFAALKKWVNDYFEDDHIEILFTRVDLINASGFANEVVKRDYDITLSSKTINEDLNTAKSGAGINTNEYPMTTMTCVDINQSRQVGLVLGHEDTTKYPYAIAAYNCLLTMQDKVVNVYFGSSTTAHEVHRTGGEIEYDGEVPSGKTLVGYSLTQGGTTVDVARVIYTAVAPHATDGKVTLYPIFETVDLTVYVWGGQSATGTTYVTPAETETLKADLITLLGASATGKNIVFKHIYGKTAEYGAQVGNDAEVIISGPKLAEAEQCGALLEGATYQKVKVVNRTFESASTRYVGVTKTAEENPLAMALLEMLCKAEITVSGVTAEPQVVNSITGNEVVYDGAIPEGKILVGFATTEGATEPAIGKVTYATVAPLTTTGAITLYPVFQKIDLTVYVWGGQSAGGTTYVTPDETEALKADFITLLGAKADGKTIVFKHVYGKTAEYGAKVGNDANVIISGKNVADAEQCGTLLEGATYQKATVINRTFESGSTRYVGVTKESETNELAMALLNMLCEQTITVTGVTAEPQVVSALSANELTPSVVVPEGKILAGWATTEGATEAQIKANAGISYATVSALAVSGAITLYPVFEDIPTTTPDLVINVLCGTASKRYITEAEVNALAANFQAYLAGTGDTKTYNIVVRSNAGATGADFNKGLDGDESVLIGASNLTSQEGFPGMYEGCTWTQITNSNVTANTSRYGGIVSTCSATQLELAQKFMAFLTATAA